MASVGRLGSRGRFSTSVRIWNIETQVQVSPTGTAHTAEIKAITSGSYRGSRVFATGSWDLICIWRAQSMPGYSSEQESNEIIDPNICGRVPLDQLPPNHRHHDLGALCLSSVDSVSTWSGARSDVGTLNANRQEWILQPSSSGGRRLGAASPRVDKGRGSDVVSVWMSGDGGPNSVIETTRRDGTLRKWIFSPRADWERQRSNWHYWHCVSVVGSVSHGKQISIRVDPYRGDVAVDFKDGPIRKRLTYDAGCPATQCALGKNGSSLVVFDERGIAHHLELTQPTD